MFQFHIGAIRRAQLWVLLLVLLCFNSILVQLEDYEQFDTDTLSASFNSILVQLEADTNKATEGTSSRFNSILVQLEGS